MLGGEGYSPLASPTEEVPGGRYFNFEEWIKNDPGFKSIVYLVFKSVQYELLHDKPQN